MLDFKQIGSNIQKLRDRFGYNQDKIAELLKISRSTLSSYETGARDIPIDKLEKIADLFCVEVHDLIEMDNEVNELNIACAFRADKIQDLELDAISKVNKIIKNYLKMMRIEENNG